MFDALIHRPPQRRWATLVLIGSLGLHVAAGLGAAAVAMWKIERLVPDRSPVEIVMAPRAADPGPEPAPAAVKEESRPIRRKIEVKTAVQPVAVKVDEPVTPSTGAGVTSVPTEPGAGGGGLPGGCAEPPCATGPVAEPVVAPVCGDGVRAGAEDCDDGNRANGDGCSRECQPEPRRVIAPPKVIESLRIAGEAHILPPPSVQSQMARDQRPRVRGVFKVCLDAAGHVTEVGRLVSTGFDDYDDRLASGVRRWRYRPYSVGGRATPVCGTVEFVYLQK